MSNTITDPTVPPARVDNTRPHPKISTPRPSDISKYSTDAMHGTCQMPNLYDIFERYALGDPHMPEDENMSKMGIVLGVTDSLTCIRENAGPPPTANGPAAVAYWTQLARSMLDSGRTRQPAESSNPVIKHDSSAEPPSPSTASSFSDRSSVSTAASSVGSVDSHCMTSSGLDPLQLDRRASFHTIPHRDLTPSTPPTSTKADSVTSKQIGPEGPIKPKHPLDNGDPLDVPATDDLRFELEIREYLVLRMLSESRAVMNHEEAGPSDRDMRKHECLGGGRASLIYEAGWRNTASAAHELRHELTGVMSAPDAHRQSRGVSRSAKSKSTHATTIPSKAVRPKVPPGSGTPLRLVSNKPLSNTCDLHQQSSSSSGAASTLTSMPPSVSSEDRFYAILVRDIRKEAHRNATRIDDTIRATLMSLYTFVFNRGPCPPPISGICGTPVCCDASFEEYIDAGDDFIDLVYAMSSPDMIGVGMYGLVQDEVDAIRGIVFLRYITGWYQEDVDSGAVIPLRKECQGKGKGRAK